MCPANDRLHRIVGRPRDRDELIAGAQDAEQHRCECVCPRDELCPHECTFRTKDAGIKLIELLASEIAVCIAEAHAEMGVRDTAYTHGVQHLLCIDLRNFVYMRERPARSIDYISAQRA